VSRSRGTPGGSDQPDETESLEGALDEEVRRGRDGVDSLHDTEAESGDEEEVDDRYVVDDREARALGVELDGGYADEPRLD
jgi:hypothetical protein